MTTSVSTRCFNSSMPDSALRMRVLPSKANGLVTTAMVRIPMSRAISATTGAAPVPVPPPMPAVTNTRSAPLSALAISSRLSSAAFLPISGVAPAPRPLVSFSPIWIIVAARLVRSACTSVFTAMKSTPTTPQSTMRLSAFPPPPPHPTTLMEAAGRSSISISNTGNPPFVSLSMLRERRGAAPFPAGNRRLRPSHFVIRRRFTMKKADVAFYLFLKARLMRSKSPSSCSCCSMVL